MAKLSCIIPYCGEHPQIGFTVNNIFCELRDSGIDFELIVIDNWCDEVARQIVTTFIHNENEPQPKEIRTRRVQDAGSAYMSGLANSHQWLKYIKYDKKLSHWQAKNAGVKEATGDILWFCDSHCIVSKNSLVNMFKYYEQHHEELNGTLHIPLSYMLEKPGLELIYKLVTDLSKGVVHYSFTRYSSLNHSFNNKEYYRVPCMSTCGMMMTREIYNMLGGWPEELGIYGGGENFINFCLAILGKTVNIFPTNPLYHYAAKRGYNWNYTDFHRNRTIASFMYGDAELAARYVYNIKGRPSVLKQIYEEVITLCKDQRDHIATNQKIEIENWVKQWERI